MDVAVITGGAGGMGLATARIMGRDHKVVLADVDQGRLDAAVAQLAEVGIDAGSAVCDITQRASVDALLQQAGEAGRVRAVVHAAGVSPQMGNPDFIVRVNAIGTINVALACLAIATDGFALVNVASFAGHTAPGPLVSKRRNALALTDPERFAAKLTAAAKLGPASLSPGFAYGLSKQFVIWYSAKMAAAFGAKGARILSVSPGSFDTAMGRLEIKSGSDRLLKVAALKRFGTPQEMAELLAFCASTRAGYLTGTDVLNDGGTKAGLTLRTMLTLARG